MKRCVLSVLAVVLLLGSADVRAMNMPSYDVVSLVYLSTDIVVADLSEDKDHKFTATVTESLYGSVRPGDKLDTLTPFLQFFDPMKDGMRVVLFLDRRPKKYNFLFSDLAKSPFAIPPSGVYLIDEYGHVHSYFQHNNPGPYVAAGFSFRPKLQEPTKEEDLKLPSLNEEEAVIAHAIGAVETVRPLLDKTATRADAPALLNLLDRSSESREHCDLRMASAISERATEQIRALNDPELLLAAHLRAGDVDSWAAIEGFLNPPSEDAVEDDEMVRFAAGRAKFLIDILADGRRELPLRLAAARILLPASAWNHPEGGGQRVLPLDAKMLAGLAGKLRRAAQAIFEDGSQDPNLRGLCLEFLMDQPGIVDEARRVYARTRSNTLRFLIEEIFLVEGDAMFESLHSPSGESASIVGPALFCGCSPAYSSGDVLWVEWRERQDLHDRRVSPSDDTELRPVLTTLKTGQRYVIAEFSELSGYSSDGAGQYQFRLSHLEGVPAGNYSVTFEFLSKGKSLSRGYAASVTIRDSSGGKQLTIQPVAGSDPPVGWVD